MLGVSMDGEESHKKFCDDQKLPYDLLADTEKKVHAAYGFKGMTRSLILIDKAGVIRYVNKEFKLKDEQWEALFAEVKALKDEKKKE